MGNISILIAVIVAMLSLVLIVYGIGVTNIGTEEVEAVEKLWGEKCSVAFDGFSALNGASGFNPEGFGGGVHFRKLHLFKTPPWQIAYVFARSYDTLVKGSFLGKYVERVKDSKWHRLLIGSLESQYFSTVKVVKMC